MEYVSSAASGPLRGTVSVPGDKSLSHRAVLFSAIAEGPSHLSGVLDAADVRATIDAVRALGAQVALVEGNDGSLEGTVTGWGSVGPRWADASRALDCGNSGTTARLLMGVLAGWPIEVRLTGDESLRRRPMRRISVPLEKMGAVFVFEGEGTLPLTETGRSALESIDYVSPVASAQVKTAILLAALRAAGTTTVREPAASRDHTERLLPAFGITVGRDERRHAAWIDGPATPVAADVMVPRDPSSAAFFAAAAALVPGSEVVLPDVSLNPTRTGFVRVLQRMSADVTSTEQAGLGAEPVGTLVARFRDGLHGCAVSAEEVPSVVDEVPILALVASTATGETTFEGVGELRVKESDRLAAVIDGLTALGAEARATGDALVIRGPASIKGATLDSLGDHRLAMTWAIAGLVANEPVTVRGFEAVDVSYPRFGEDLEALR